MALVVTGAQDLTSFRRTAVDSTVTPNYAELKAQGTRLPVNYYLKEVTTGRSTTTVRPDTEEIHSGLHNPHPDFSGFRTSGKLEVGSDQAKVRSEAELVNTVHARLLSKVHNVEIDLGIALGEYRETANFIHGAMVKTAKSYRMLRRGDVSGAIRTLTGRKNESLRHVVDASSDVWLSYQLAFKPLANDVYDAVRILVDGIDHQDPYLTVYTHQKTEDEGVLEDETIRYGYQVRNRVSGAVTFRIDDPFVYSLSQLGVVNPLNVVWELVPFSFVVDWFIPIGTWISAIVPPQGVEFIDGYTYQKARISIDDTRKYPAWGPESSTRVSWSYTYKERIPLNSWPTVRFIVPDLSLSKGKIATGMALLWSVLRGEGDSGHLRV